MANHSYKRRRSYRRRKTNKKNKVTKLKSKHKSYKKGGMFPVATRSDPYAAAAGLMSISTPSDTAVVNASQVLATMIDPETGKRILLRSTVNAELQKAFDNLLKVDDIVEIIPEQSAAAAPARWFGQIYEIHEQGVKLRWYEVGSLRYDPRYIPNLDQQIYNFNVIIGKLYDLTPPLYTTKSD